MGLKTLKANSTLITNLALNKYIPLVDVVEELDKDLDDTLE